MVKFVETTISPQHGRWEITVRETNNMNLSDYIEWAKENLSGKIFWRRTQYRDPKKCPIFVNNVRKVNFNDGYMMLTFWFTNKKDAAIFRLWWFDPKVML